MYTVSEKEIEEKITDLLNAEKIRFKEAKEGSNEEEYLGDLISAITLCGLITYGFAPRTFNKICYPYTYLGRKLKGIRKRLTDWWYGD